MRNAILDDMVITLLKLMSGNALGKINFRVYILIDIDQQPAKNIIFSIILEGGYVGTKAFPPGYR